MTSSEGCLLAPVEVLVEPRRRIEDALHQLLLGIGRTLVQVLLEDGEEVGLILLGHADQHADDLDRQPQREVAHEVEVVTPDEPVDDLLAERPDLGLEARPRPAG